MAKNKNDIIWKYLVIERENQEPLRVSVKIDVDKILESIRMDYLTGNTGQGGRLTRVFGAITADVVKDAVT